MPSLFLGRNCWNLLWALSSNIGTLKNVFSFEKVDNPLNLEVHEATPIITSANSTISRAKVWFIDNFVVEEERKDKKGKVTVKITSQSARVSRAIITCGTLHQRDQSRVKDQ